MTLRVLSKYFILLSSFAMSACSDSGSGSSESADAGGLSGPPEPIQQPDAIEIPEVVRMENTLPEIEAIAGLWNNSTTEEGGVIDVYYLEITSEGAWNNFNYLGDGVDQGQNCYALLPGRVTSLGGVDYQVSTPFGNFDTTVEVTDGRLVITNDAGSVALPELTGLSSVDFNEC